MDKKKVALAGILVILAVVLYLHLNQGDTVKTTEYNNSQFGFSLTMEEDFRDRVLVKAEDKTIYFLSLEIKENSGDDNLGVIGRIEIYSKGEVSKTTMLEAGNSYGLQYLGENDIYLFGWAHATDVQVPPDSQNLLKVFRELEQEFEQVITTFKVFPPEGKEIPENKTDAGTYVGLADNNFFEVKINDGTAKVFMISEKIRNHFDSLDLQGGEEVKIVYYENQYGQNVVQDIETVTP